MQTDSLCWEHIGECAVLLCTVIALKASKECAYLLALFGDMLYNLAPTTQCVCDCPVLYTLPTGSCSKCSRCDIFCGKNMLHYSLHLVQLLLCHPVELKLLHSILGDMTCQHEFFRAKSDSCTFPFNLTSNYLSREGRQDSQSDITCILYHSVTGVCCYA